MTATTLESRDAILDAMQSPDFYDHDVSSVTMIQTHISWVFLTGEYAYKIKKPMDFGFLNFTELSQRKHFCEEEIRLNKRLADKVYLQTVKISGSEQQPVFNGDGEAIEYAVKMRQFEQSMLIDKLLANNRLESSHIDDIADQVADFHQSIKIADDKAELGTAASVNAPVIQNFDQLDPLIKQQDARDQLARLRSWSEKEFSSIETLLKQRKENGFIRECHGDMHLGNMALINNKVTIFDGIEFNDEFRWIDVMSEVAFLVMDLIDRGATNYAYRFLNRYLEKTGDYEGLQVLRFYLVYRAMVRAKIASFTLLTPDLPADQVETTLQQYRSYTELAESFTQHEQATLFITHGVSGSGKTTVSQKLLESHALIRLRSDIERKRLFNIGANDSSRSLPDSGIYTADASRKTYLQLQKFAKLLIEQNYSVIVDATFLDSEFRQMFQELAMELSVKYSIIDLEADKKTLEQRLIDRNQSSNNASEADLNILEKQLASYQPLLEEEQGFVQTIDF